MRAVAQFFGAALLLLAAGTSSFGQGAEAEPPHGRTLFVDRWSAHDKRSTAGDGLGPMHNATSCAACHHQGGPGGGGDRRHNVELLSLVPVKASEAATNRFAERVTAIHPGFKIEGAQVRPNLVLHRFGSEGDYFDFRARLLGVEEPRADAAPVRRAVTAAAIARRRQKQTSAVETLPPIDGITLRLSQRNTPALWGAGLIDAIAEPVIRENAAAQKRSHPELAGRVPRASGGGIGRFGWRGQTATLEQFVLTACANELGLQTKGHPQALNPLTADYRLDGEDLSADDADALVDFVADLPRPVEAAPRTAFAAETVRKGEHVFERIGCAVCHPRELGKINGVFSDLLLHDMGARLEDPVEPNPDVELVEQQFFGYSGGGTVFVERERADPSLPRQWRTPPLWGVKDSAPYLHDGRADTLSEAILLHGGQAAASAAAFRVLPDDDRARLIAFLETLTAPAPPRAAE
jgi:CxxC motif-containing protein (DUF1111 family)